MTRWEVSRFDLAGVGFNTASGMRSHVTEEFFIGLIVYFLFQYRKRYEVTCDVDQYGEEKRKTGRFNTASGMRSHVTWLKNSSKFISAQFQYRKRYEVTCDCNRRT